MRRQSALKEGRRQTKPTPQPRPSSTGRATWRVVFIRRAATACLYATAAPRNFFAFLTTLSSDTADARLKRYLCALSVVINMVAVAHYKIIVKIRSFDLGAGAAENARHLRVGLFAKWNPFLGIGIEMAVDAVRHSDWLVPFANRR